MDGEGKKTHLRRGTRVDVGGSKGKGDVDKVKGPNATLQGRCRRWSLTRALTELQAAPLQLVSRSDQGQPG